CIRKRRPQGAAVLRWGSRRRIGADGAGEVELWGMARSHRPRGDPLRLKVRSQAGEQPSVLGVRTCEEPWEQGTRGLQAERSQVQMLPPLPHVLASGRPKGPPFCVGKPEADGRTPQVRWSRGRWRV